MVLQRRGLCTKPEWRVKQVTKSNLSQTLESLKPQISQSDFIAVSLQRTGSVSAPWHRVFPFDTPQTAYSKARFAADKFQLFQFAVCPFSVRPSKVVAYPYNFHLFPRDELNIGMPSYSFSCQTSYLTSMAREGFDFNVCIYDGISYLSRVQESAANAAIGNPIPSNNVKTSSSTPSVADTVFMGRIKSRVKHWKNACGDSSTRTEDVLSKFMRKLILGSEPYGSRPSINLDVSSEHQVQLVLEVLAEFDGLVALLIPSKGGGTQAVRVILTSSEEDKDLLKRELQDLEEEQRKKVCGFREVIDLISASQKPVVSHNSLNDFAFIHSKFLAPLPPNIDEFTCSLRMVFPYVLDVNHLMKEIGPLKKVTNLSAAASRIKRRFFVPIDMEIPHEALNEDKIHGQNVLRISHLLANLCSILKITPEMIQSDGGHVASALEGYANIFYPHEDQTDGDLRVWTDDTRKVSSEDLVFIWGLSGKTSAGSLKRLLQGSHSVFSGEFDVRMVDRSCAIVVFWQSGLSQAFLESISSNGISGRLRKMVSEGLRAAGYETYEKACKLGFREADLADSMDKALEEPDHCSEDDSETKPSQIYWSRDSIINLDEL